MLIFDLETDGLLETVEFIHCVHIMDTEGTNGVERYNDHGYKCAGTVAEGVARLGAADRVLAHNGIGYDYQVLDKLYPSWKNGEKPKLEDSVVMSSVIFPDLKEKDFMARKAGGWKILGKWSPCPEKMGGIIGSHSLKAWGIRLGEFKDDYDPRTETGLDLSVSMAWKLVGWTERMDDYCVQDVLVTAALVSLLESKNYSPQCLDLEHNFARIMARQERRGFTLDVEAGRKLEQVLLERQAELEDELQAQFPRWWEADSTGAIPEAAQRLPKVKNGPRNETAGAAFTKVRCCTFNAGSTAQIASRLMALYGWVPEVVSATGEPSCTDEILATLSYPPIAALREYLVIAKRLGQLSHGTQAILRKVKDDGRVHGRVKTNGASTGRCTHSNPNVANTPSVAAAYGAAFRGLYTAADGFRLVGADASGLELRCLGHYMAHYDNGSYSREVIGGDVHWLNLQAIGIAKGPMDKSNPHHKQARALGKTWTYGYLYGAGESLSGVHFGAALAAYEGRDKPSPKHGRKSRAAFKKNLPALKTLEDNVKAKAKAAKVIKGLDGRLVPIRSEHSALNALLQSAGAVIMKQALVCLDDNLAARGLQPGVDYEFVANVHDEWQVEVRDGDLPQLVADESLKAFNQAGEILKLRVAIDGEAKIGRTWADTH
jgi:DNA polymerase-1